MSRVRGLDSLPLGLLTYIEGGGISMEEIYEILNAYICGRCKDYFANAAVLYKVSGPCVNTTCVIANCAVHEDNPAARHAAINAILLKIREADRDKNKSGGKPKRTVRQASGG